MRYIKIVSLLMVMALISGCAHHRHSNYSYDQVYQNYYATVISVETIRQHSHVGENAVAGGLWSIVHSGAHHKDDIIFVGLLGAAISGVATAISEGRRTAYRNIIIDDQNYQMTVVTRDQVAYEGDCVLVTEGDRVTLRVVADDLCD